MDAEDNFHIMAKDYFSEILEEDNTLYSSNYIIVETIALVQNRLGINATRLFIQNILPLVNISWIDSTIHNTVINNLISLQYQEISLVDFSSFHIMRHHDIYNAFTFDNHFKSQGFKIFPASI
jgi:predicted nucleic acid-binding protein